jgi:hypothetical protein
MGEQMNLPRCPICSEKMIRNGKTSAGRQRWICKTCRLTKTNRINSDAKQLKIFLTWLLSKKRQIDMPSQGRSFRNHTAKFWRYWALPPIVDEVHRVIYVDGIYLARNVVILIACSDEHVLGWYLARSENSRSWEALISRIAPPIIVVSDGGSGLAKALWRIWPETEVQRCTFHAFCQVKRYTTSRPNLPAGMELYALAKDLLHLETLDQAQLWVALYLKWCGKWDGFLQEVTVKDGRRELTHHRLVKARNSLNVLINKGQLFTYLDDLLTIGGPLPATNNRIEGGVNAQLRQVLREHRGLSLTRRIKAIFWWCYLHTECPLSCAQILKTMPTDEDIDRIYKKLTYVERNYESIPQWGDAIVWSEFHTSDPWRHDWD